MLFLQLETLQAEIFDLISPLASVIGWTGEILPAVFSHLLLHANIWRLVARPAVEEMLSFKNSFPDLVWRLRCKNKKPSLDIVRRWSRCQYSSSAVEILLISAADTGVYVKPLRVCRNVGGKTIRCSNHARNSIQFSLLIFRQVPTDVASGH